MRLKAVLTKMDHNQHVINELMYIPDVSTARQTHEQIADGAKRGLGYLFRTEIWRCFSSKSDSR